MMYEKPLVGIPLDVLRDFVEVTERRNKTHPDQVQFFNEFGLAVFPEGTSMSVVREQTETWT